MSVPPLPPETPRHCDRELWRARVSAELPRYDEHWGHLDSAEQQRAERFRTDADRVRFVIARSTLRQLLGERLGLASQEIAFGKNAFDKPCLRNSPDALYFNTSHSGDWVLHAFNSAGPIGVDVERLRPELGDIDQFHSVISADELALLHALPASQRARAFATLWVRKEAYVKALGEGLSRRLQDISISTDAVGRPWLLRDGNPGRLPAGWHFEDIEIDEHHVACMVYRGELQSD